MTAVLPDIDQLPDLDAVVPCECPGHGDQGCATEAEVLTWNSPCGHEQETLCEPCALGARIMVLEEGCASCGGPFSCESCDADIEDLGMRTL